jgi:hypothetical protein
MLDVRFTVYSSKDRTMLRTVLVFLSLNLGSRAFASYVCVDSNSYS